VAVAQAHAHHLESGPFRHGAKRPRREVIHVIRPAEAAPARAPQPAVPAGVVRHLDDDVAVASQQFAAAAQHRQRLDLVLEEGGQQDQATAARRQPGHSVERVRVLAGAAEAREARHRACGGRWRQLDAVRHRASRHHRGQAVDDALQQLSLAATDVEDVDGALGCRRQQLPADAGDLVPPEHLAPECSVCGARRMQARLGLATRLRLAGEARFPGVFVLERRVPGRVLEIDEARLQALPQPPGFRRVSQRPRRGAPFQQWTDSCGRRRLGRHRQRPGARTSLCAASPGRKGIASPFTQASCPAR